MLESSDSKQLIVAKEDLYTLLDAMSTFTKHENQVEMNNTLGELANFISVRIHIATS